MKSNILMKLLRFSVVKHRISKFQQQKEQIIFVITGEIGYLNEKVKFAINKAIKNN